jgi:chorismate mutase
MTQKKTDTLSSLRLDIDRIDRGLLDLIAQRADVVRRIGAIKEHEGLPAVNAAREADVLRRLVRDGVEGFPLSSLLAIWRELIGAAGQMQRIMPVVVAGDDPAALSEARMYFGAAAPVDVTPAPLMALSQVREGRAAFAVLPEPVDGEDRPWWPQLMQDSNRTLRVIARLPYDEGIAAVPRGAGAAWLVVATMPYHPSGDDHSFVVLRLTSDVSRSRLNAMFDDAALPITRLQQQREGGLCFIEVASYIDSPDARFEKIVAALGDVYGGAVFTGGYARLVIDQGGQDAD